MNTTSREVAVTVRSTGARSIGWIGTWLVACMLCLVSACSGGGGGGSPAPTRIITAQPSDTQVESGATATFSAQATDSAQFQWQRRLAQAAANDWQDLAGATLAQYTTAATTDGNNGDQYRVIVNWSGAASLTSSIATLTVQPAPTAPSITVQPLDVAVIEEQYASFSVTASGTSMVYQWQTSRDGAAWTDFAGGTSATLTMNVQLADDGTQVRVTVSNALGAVTSAVAHLAVQHAPSAPVFQTSPQSTSVIVGQAATFNAQAFGTPAPDIAWQTSTDGSTWTTILDATAGSYTLPMPTLQDNQREFRAVGTNSLGAATSGIAVLTVSPAPAAPVIVAAPIGTTVSPGGDAAFNATVSGQPSPALQWQVSTDAGVTFTNVNGAVSASYTAYGVGTGQDGWRYRIVATNSQGSVTSAAATLSVPTPPSFTLQPSSAAWRPGAVPAYFLAAVTGGTSLQWQTSRDGGTTWIDVVGATGTSFQLTSTSDANVNRVRLAASNSGATAYSSVATVTPHYWAPVTGQLTSSGLHGVRWTGPTTVIAAGGIGTMLRSTDSGATWSITAELDSSTPLTLAAHGQNAVALGYNWSVLRSVDAGAHWIRSDSNLNMAGSARGVAFSGSAATAVGDGGTVERSTDGGITWQAAATGGVTTDLHGVAFNASGIGIAVGGSGSVLRSVDGGANWTSVASGQAFYLEDVAFVNASTVVAVGTSGSNGAVMRSTDAGLTWQAVSTTTTLQLLHVAFDGAGNGTATSGASQTNRLHTADGGQTWTETYATTQVEAVDYAPVGTAATAVAVGFGGELETSVDGGLTWTIRSPGPHQVLRGIAFASATVGVAVGDAGTLMRSVDGGDSWTTITPPTFASMYDVAFPTPQVAVAVGDNGTVWRSADAGATWTAAQAGFGQKLNSVRFTSSTHGVAVGSANILTTDDAGLTWQYANIASQPLVQSVAFGSSLVGVAVGDGLPPGGWGFAGGAMVRTTDGGATWSAVALSYSIDLTSVAFVDANTVVAVGFNGELRSTDGGLTWSGFSGPFQANAVRFSSATEGIAVSDDGFFGRTHDGGLTWPDGEYVAGDELCGVVVSPAGKTFIITAGGAIYRDNAP